MQADNRLLTNLIKCEKEHHSALLALLVRSHTSLAALSAYASTAAPPVAQALRGCIQSFAAADEGLRGYAAAVEGWKEELKEVKRVEDELKVVVKDKDILVGRLIKASKQKIPTSSIQAGPAPIPTSSPSSSSLSFSTSQPYHYTPTPHATQHINSKLAQAQRELQACETHLASKEAELAEVRRSAIAEGMARRCRAMVDAGHVWRERGESGLGALHELSGEDAGAPPRRSYSTTSSIAPSHSASQHRSYSRSASPSPGTYHSISGGYQRSHPLPPLPERNSWHVQDDTPRRPISLADPPRRPISLIDPPRAPTLHRHPISSNDLPALPDQVTFDIPPPHSIGHDTEEFIPLGRPVSRWGDSSSEEGEYKVVDNQRGERWEEDVDPEIIRAVERMGVVGPVKGRDEVQHTPPTPPDTVSSTSPARLPDLTVTEATPQKKKRKKTKGRQHDMERVDKALPDIVDEQGSSEVGSGPPAARAISPEPPTPARTFSPGPTTAISSTFTSPRPMSPDPPHLGSPIVLAPTRTSSAPSPKPGSVVRSIPAPARATPVAAPSPVPTAQPFVPVPAAQPFVPAPSPRPFVPVPATLGDGDPRGDDVIVPAKGLDSATTDYLALHSSRTNYPNEGPIYSTEAPTEQPNHSTEQPTHSTEQPTHSSEKPTHLSESDSSDSELDTEARKASLSDTLALDTATVFETPRASVGTFDTPRAGPETSTDVYSQVAPGAHHSPTAAHSPAPESVYATPQVIPSNIPRVPRLETPQSLEFDTRPRVEAPRSPRSPNPEISQLPHPETKSPLHTSKSPILDTPKLPLLDTPQSPGLVTPMETSSRPKTKQKSGDDAPKRKKTIKKGHSRQSSSVSRPELRPRQPSAEERADLAAMLRDSDRGAPHVHFPAPGGVFVPSAPQPGTLHLPSNGGTTRSDIGPARGHTFEPVPAGRNRSGSVNGSTSFFGRVAGLFGRKKPSDGYISSAAGQAWRTRTDGNISRNRDDSSEDEQPTNLVTVTNVNPRFVSVDNNSGSPKRALGRKLTKAEKGQTLRVGPPDSPSRTRKPSITEEQIVPAKKFKSRSVDGVSRKGSLRSNTSDPGRASSDVGRKREPASLMAIVEGPGLVLPSEFVSRQTDSPAPDSPATTRGQTLAVPPARAVSPTSTAAPRPIRATSPMPLKSALRNRTPSPLPPSNDTPQPSLAVPVSNAPAQSPRNSISESVYETGEEDFDSADEDARSDITASGAQATTLPTPASTQPVHSPGAALAAFKDNLQISTGTGSVSTAGPRSANSAARKSVRINPAPPQMSATPAATPGSELEEEAAWTRDDKPVSSGGWASRIGKGWEDSSDESVDEEYERVRNALATSSKHMDAMNRPIHGRR